MFGTNIFGGQQFLGQTFSEGQTLLGLKILGGSKKMWDKHFWGSKVVGGFINAGKKMWGFTHFGGKNSGAVKKMYGTFILGGQQTCWDTNFRVVNKFLGQQFVGGQTFLGQTFWAVKIFGWSNLLGLPRQNGVRSLWESEDPTLAYMIFGWVG